MRRLKPMAFKSTCNGRGRVIRYYGNNCAFFHIFQGNRGFIGKIVSALGCALNRQRSDSTPTHIGSAFDIYGTIVRNIHCAGKSFISTTYGNNAIFAVSTCLSYVIIHRNSNRCIRNRLPLRLVCLIRKTRFHANVFLVNCVARCKGKSSVVFYGFAIIRNSHSYAKNLIRCNVYSNIEIFFILPICVNSSNFYRIILTRFNTSCSNDAGR